MFFNLHTWASHQYLILLQEGTGGGQRKSEILDNLDNADFWTPNQAFSTEKSGDKIGAEISSKDLNLEGSPETPDLLPSRSPQLAEEREGRITPKLKSGPSIPSPAIAIDSRLASPAPSVDLREGAVEKVAFDCSEQSICRIRDEAEHGRTKDEASFDIAITDGLSNDVLHSGKQEGTAATTVTEHLNSGDTDSFPATDGVLNQCACPLVDGTSDHEVQFENEKEGHREKAPPVSTGTLARNSPRFFAQAIL